MSKTVTTTIDRFDGGFSNDLRSTNTSKYAITKHFDAFTFPHRLVPHRMTEADENKNFFLTRFAYAPTDWSASAAPTTYKLFGYGVVSGQTTTGRIAIYTYNIDSGIDQTWTVTTNGQAGSGSRDTEAFNYYRGYLYGWTGNSIWRFKTADDTAIDLSFQSITYTTVCQGVHHLSDDILYLFSDNKVHKYDGTTFTTAALTLPNSMKITAACAFGNFLAIGCTTVGNGQKKSTVFLWDRDSSLTTISERHELGEGSVRHLANLNGKLIAVSDYYTNSTLSLGRPQVFIKQVGDTRSLNEIEMDTVVSGGLSAANFVDFGRLYFPLKAVFNSDTRFGIWAVDESGKATVEFVEEEATSYEGFYKVGNVWFIAHSADGSCNRSDDGAAYSTTNASTYESLKFNSGEPLKRKKLIGVSVFTEPLPSAGQVVLKYRKDEETSWTTIFTHTTDNSLGHSAVNIESSGANFPEHKEIQFQILSTGGAVITGLKFKTEILETEPYG